MNVAILAGEASGDRVGGQLAREVLALAPDAVLWGTGGRFLQEAGVEVVLETSSFGVVGIASALGLLPKMLAGRKRLLGELKRRHPDVIVAIDAGALHLGFGPWEGTLPWARKNLPEARVLYYFPPGSWRRTLTHTSLGPVTDAVASPFRWNASELNRLGVNATWVGHPLLDLVTPSEAGTSFAARFGIELDRPIVGLLPGSRRQEIRHILPVQLRAASLIHRRVPGVQFVLALAPTVNRDEVVRALEQVRHQRVEQPGPRSGPALPRNIVVADGTAEELARRQRAWIERAGLASEPPGDGNFPLVIVEGATYDVMNVSDALISTSGTATLEAAILKKPMVIVYKLGPENALEAHLARKKIPVIGMPNLLAERFICPEFVQEGCRPEPIAQEIIGLLLEPERLLQQKAELAEAVKELGEPGGAARAAKMVLELATR
jgi:lipid-A-disaccharide synthase